MVHAQFIIWNANLHYVLWLRGLRAAAQFIILNTEFLVFDPQFLVLNPQFIIIPRNPAAPRN